MDYKFISETEIFKGISTEETRKILSNMRAKEKNYSKGDYILRAGDTTKETGIVMCGSVNIERDDIQGGHTIIANIPKGNVFAEVYACTFNEPLMVSAVAAEKTDVLFLNTDYILSENNRLMKNLLHVIARKNLNLTKKINVIMPKTIRERVIAFLSEMAVKYGKNDFEVPFNRQQMADYLCVDRSAMSSELGKMKKEGIISFKKNRFHIREFWKIHEWFLSFQ